MGSLVMVFGKRIIHVIVQTSNRVLSLLWIARALSISSWIKDMYIKELCDGKSIVTSTDHQN